MPAVHSMTGFARQECAHAEGVLVCEIRSVNHRYLELALRVSDTLRVAENAARERLRERIGRGKVDCALRIAPRSETGGALALDEAQLDAVLTACVQVSERAQSLLPMPSALEVLRWPGVLRENPTDTDALGIAALALLDGTVAEFAAMRAREGARLADLIEQRLAGIESLLGSVRTVLPEAIAAQRARLAERLAELLAAPLPERLDQELAMLAARGDIAEELDRLEAHIAETRRSLGAGGACGRRLDFLMQEFNREANTLSSKSLAAGITRAAVEMKVLIEQMREQVQNIE